MTSVPRDDGSTARKQETSAAARPAARAGVRMERVDGTLVLINSTSGLTHHLNETAAAVWEACDGSTSVDDLVERMVSRFDVDAATARHDVAAVLRRFQEVGLIERYDDI